MLNALFSRRPLLRIRLQHPLQQLFALRAHIVDLHLDGWDGACELVSHKHLLAIASLKKVCICYQVEEKTSNTKYVRFSSKRSPFEDVRCHISRGAALQLGLRLICGQAGETEVRYAYLHLCLIHQQNVIRFDVSVNDSFPMNQVNRKDQLVLIYFLRT